MLTSRTRRYLIPGPPVPYDRAITTSHRTTGQPIRVHSNRYRTWRSQAKRDLAAQGGRYDGPIAVSITVTPTGCQITIERTLATRPKGLRGDVDNYAKACLDALQTAGVITDDRQVVALTVRFPEEDQ